MLVSAMLRRYNYPGQYLPHIQKDNRSLFVTFATYHRWHLPDAACDLALEAAFIRTTENASCTQP
jgi:hypothetical protein